MSIETPFGEVKSLDIRAIMLIEEFYRTEDQIVYLNNELLTLGHRIKRLIASEKRAGL